MAVVLAVALVALTQSPSRAHAAPKPIPLFVFAGQSNMVGYGARWTQAAGARLEAQSVWWFSNGGLGPEASASTLLARNGPIAIVKVAVSGTNLHRQWSPSTKDGLYWQLVGRVQAAVETLREQGFNASVRAIFWMQGESDTDTAGNASSYAANLVRFVSSLRLAVRAPDAAFFEAQIANAGPYTDVLRRQQWLATSRIPRLVLVVTDDLERCPDDPLHFDTRGTIDLGERFARQYAAVS